VAKLLHSYPAVCKVPASSCISLMFSRWRGYFDIHTFLTTKKKVLLHLPECWPQTASENWNFFRSYDVKWHTVVHFGDIQESYTQEWSTRTWWLASYSVYVLWTVYPHHDWELSSVSNKKDWSQRMYLASVCTDKQEIKFSRLQHELVEWRNRCIESKSVCTPPNTNVIYFDTLYDETGYRTSLFNRFYPDE